MIVVCESEDCDYLAALLSGDWFADRWSEVGLKANKAVQQGARRIVEEYLGGRSRLVEIDLSDQRRARTRSDLESLASEYPEVGLRDLLNGGKGESPALFWLLEVLTLEAVKDVSDAARNWLPPGTLAGIHDSFERTLDSSPPLDLEKELLDARTPWDSKLRGLFEDNPTWLTDWLQARSYVSARFQAYWETLCTRLGAEEIELVRSWYQSEVNRLSAEQDMRLPDWMRSPTRN